MFRLFLILLILSFISSSSFLEKYNNIKCTLSQQKVLTLYIRCASMCTSDEQKGDEKMKKPSVSDVALVLSIFVLLFQIFCHFILPKL
nr:MAG TPA: hypothetical protein [Bacteriophage sp.]